MTSKLTYHFGNAVPLACGSDGSPPADEWLSPASALERVGLWLRNHEDRLAWEYYYSPHVRYAVRLGDAWVIYEGPYRLNGDGSLSGYEPLSRWSRLQSLNVLLKAGLSGYSNMATLRSEELSRRLRQLPAETPEIAFTHDPAAYRLCAADTDRILDKSPFLFDSLALTAIQVGTRKIVYEAPGNKDRPLSSAPVPPGSGAARTDYVAYRRALARYRSEHALYETSRHPSPRMRGRQAPPKPGMSLADFLRAQKDGKLTGTDTLTPGAKLQPGKGYVWRHPHEIPEFRMAHQEHLVLLNDPWTVKPAYRLDESVQVAPLFFVKNRDLLPDEFRDHWWFERVAARFIDREKRIELGESVDAEIRRELVDRLQEHRELQRRELWPHLPGHEGPSGSSSLLALYSSNEERATRFLRETRRYASLAHGEQCLRCGTDLKKAKERAKGRPRDFCSDCEVFVSPMQRQWERDFTKRRHPSQ